MCIVWKFEAKNGEFTWVYVTLAMCLLAEGIWNRELKIKVNDFSFECEQI